MTRTRLAVFAAFVALLGIAAASTASAWTNCQTTCQRYGNQTTCNRSCF